MLLLDCRAGHESFLSCGFDAGSRLCAGKLCVTRSEIAVLSLVRMELIDGLSCGGKALTRGGGGTISEVLISRGAKADRTRQSRTWQHWKRERRRLYSL